ncbi:hypothetical protein C8R43DRAFT_1040943 [Mycena crocata]|nr:hypothetical protein C8R43DRAFT_1040943 [Mycena crocata]
MAPTGICATCGRGTQDPPVQLPPDATRMSHIRELLRSRAEPPTELPSTLDILSAELARYDGEIAKLQQEIDALGARRSVFQTHYDDCRGLLAPVRRLPPEVLVEIFQTCWQSFTPTPGDVDEEFERSTAELETLAQAPVMILSQVCLRWHDIALGTPALWGKIELGNTLWEDPTRLGTVVKQLQSVLNRGANHPISLRLTNSAEESLPCAVLQLLAQHAPRWTTVTLACPFADIRALAALNVDLSNLEALMIHAWGEGTSLDMFKSVPRLKTLYFSADSDEMAAFSVIPFEQLIDIHCLDVLGREPPTAASFMPRLSQHATLQLQLSPLIPEAGLDPEFAVPPITSDIAALHLGMARFYVGIDVEQTLDLVLDSLTLPHLTKITFETGDYPLLTLPWRHSQFLALAHRSAFHAHLHTLHLPHIVIPETELIQTLDALPALVSLSLSDHQLVPRGGVDHVLVTDTLLAALTNLALLPRLRVFACQSLLKFADSAYLGLVESRVKELPSESPFECELWWMLGHNRSLDGAVSARLQELAAQKRLAFLFQPAEYEA